MQTVTLEITNDLAKEVLQTLEEKAFIRIIEKPLFDSPALPGKALNLQAFKNWIANSEVSPTISLNDAKALWQNKRKQLMQAEK